MIKLYVVIQWSRGANHMQHLKNINGLIHEQTYQTLDARDHLVETRNILPNARQRNHDIATAVEVLAKGEPSKLPAAIEKDSIPPKPFTDSQARAIIHELDEAIRVRLACDEPVPLRLKSSGCDVSDGRVRLTAPSLFSLSLTLSGAKEDDRWYLLTIQFDYNITGQGKDRFPQDLWEAQREGFIATANQVLEPRSAPPAAEGEEGGEAAAATVRVDRPIVRLFNFLQSQALEYQLDILAFQVTELVRLAWKGVLSWSWQDRTLVIDYWLRPAGESARSGQTSLGPVKGGRVKLVVQPRKKETAIEELGRQIDEEGEDAVATEHDENCEHHLQLAVTWEADDAPLPDRPDVFVDAQDLNAEALLLSVVTRHAEMAIAVFRDRVAASTLRRTISSMSSPSELILDLHATLTVCLSIDPKKGKLSLSQRSGGGGSDADVIAPTLSQSSSASRLREASDLINSSPASLVDVLFRLQTAAIRSDLEQKAAYLGLRSLRSLNLNQEEYTKFEVQPSHIHYLPLEQCPTYYLAFVIKNADVRASLVSAMPALYGGATTANSTGSAMELHSLQWLDIDKIAGAKKDGTSRAVLSSLDIGRLHSYAVALTISSQLQTQLRMRGVAFVLLPAVTMSPPGLLGSTCTRAEDAIPSMSARTIELFGPSAQVLLKPNALVRLGDYWNPASCYIEVVVRMRFNVKRVKAVRDQGLNSNMSSAGSLASVRFNAKRSELSLRTQNLGQALDIFALDWQRIAKIASLASQLSTQRRGVRDKGKGEQQRFLLLDYDVRSARFAYGPEHGLEALLYWEEGSEGEIGAAMLAQPQVMPSGYRLAFTSSDGSTNPHTRIQSYLEDLLNGSSSSPDWSALLFLLDSTIPILSTLGRLRDAALDDAASPDVEWLNATWYRVVFAEAYRLDVRIAKGGKVMVVQDAAAGGRELMASSKEGKSKGDDDAEIPELRQAMEAAAASSGAGGPSAGVLVLGQTMLCDLRRTRGKVAQATLTALVELVGRNLAEIEGLL